MRKDRSGDELRDIKSGGGTTTFDVEFEMLEDVKSADLGTSADDENNNTLKE